MFWPFDEVIFDVPTPSLLHCLPEMIKFFGQKIKFCTILSQFNWLFSEWYLQNVIFHFDYKLIKVLFVLKTNLDFTDGKIGYVTYSKFL
jgi:hypothetical protein